MSISLQLDQILLALANTAGVGMRATIDPASETDKGYLYAKYVDGVNELFYEDGYGTISQITKDGQLNVTGVASGQLGGTYPGPDVRGIRETAGPTLLTIGAILDGQVLVRDGLTLIGSSTAGGAGGKVKVRVDDTADGYLHEKLLTGSGLSFAIGNPGGNETLTIDAYGEAKVSSADTTFGYLFDKLQAGSGVSLVKQNPSGNETILVSVDAGIDTLKFDERGSDPSYFANDGYLYSKDIDGYTELHYLNDRGHVVQLTYDGYVGCIGREDEIVSSTGVETFIALTKTPLPAPRRRSKRDLDVYRNGILMRYVSALGAGLSEWTYSSSLNRVQFVASGGPGDWYVAIYRANN